MFFQTNESQKKKIKHTYSNNQIIFFCSLSYKKFSISTFLLNLFFGQLVKKISNIASQSKKSLTLKMCHYFFEPLENQLLMFLFDLLCSLQVYIGLISIVNIKQQVYKNMRFPLILAHVVQPLVVKNKCRQCPVLTQEKNGTCS